MSKILSNTFFVLVASYAVTVSGSILLRTLFDEDVTLVAFINAVLHVTILPALVLLPLSLILRRWGVSLLLLPPVIFFGVMYAPRLLPKNIQPPADAAPQLHVMTFNLLALDRDYGEVMEILRESGADIISLQEVTDKAAEAIQQNLTDLYPYSVFYPGGIPGIGLLSKYPIKEDSVWRTVLQQLRVVIDWDGCDLVLYNVHPMTPMASTGFSGRNEEIANLLERIATETDPVLLMGDFNTTDIADPYSAITAEFEDAYRVAGEGIGITHHLRGIPILRIDYVFYRAPFRAYAASVNQNGGGSDHRPLSVSLVWDG